MTKLLITGASGFIGSACLARLQGGGFQDIHAASRRVHPDDSVTWHQTDLLDHNQITALLEDVQPTHILHAAWEVTPRIYATSPANTDWLNASAHMADIFGKLGGQYFLGLGTCAEYAASEIACKEDQTPIDPNSLYGQTKAEFSKVLQEKANAHNFKAGWLRVFLPYGPGDPWQRLIPHITAKLAAGETVETTHGRQEKDFIHVHDIAEITARMLETQSSGIYNAGSSKPISVRSVISRIATYFDQLNSVQFDAMPLSPHEPMLLLADMSKTQNDLGFFPQTDMMTELDRLCAAYVASKP